MYFLLQGMLACGFFVDVDPLENTTQGQKGLFYGGGGELLLVQLIAVLAIASWSGATSFILLYVSVDLSVGDDGSIFVGQG